VPRVPEAASTVPRVVRAKHPNHVWMVDLTDVKGLFGLVTFKVAVKFDAFSRMPLSVRVFSKEASAREIAQIVSRTSKRHGRPAHFVSDHARCFTGQVFRRKLLWLGVKQRFGAVGKKGSIALIERRWRTLKDALGLRLLRPLVAEDLAVTVEMGLLHYSHFRPHQALGGATPGRRVRARSHRRDRGTGLCPPPPAAFPIAPLHRRLIFGTGGEMRVENCLCR
jgi:transposase InsO family protein